MSEKRTEGYWIHQLTDEDLNVVLKNVTEHNKNAKFVKIIKTAKTDKGFKINYQIKRLNCYLSNFEPNIELFDYKSSNTRATSHLVKYMMEKFGIEYIENFIQFANENINNSPSNIWTKNFIHLKEYAEAQMEALNSKSV